MTRTSWVTLVAVFLGALVVTYGIVALAVGAGSPSPQAHWLTHVFLLVLTVVLVLQGRGVKRMVDGKETSMTPIEASRVLTYAKTASVVGSVIAGYFVAIAIFVATLPPAPVREQALVSGVAGFLVCAAMVAAGLVVEHWCSVDPPSDDDDGSHGPRGFAGA